MISNKLETPFYFYFYSKNMINTIIFNKPDLSVFMFMTIIHTLKSSV